MARSFVFEQVGDAWLGLEDDSELHWDALDGMRLGYRFRLLAAVLGALLEGDGRADRSGMAGLRVDALWRDGAPASHLLLVIVAGRARPRLDTS